MTARPRSASAVRPDTAAAYDAELRDAVERALGRALGAAESAVLLLCYGLDEAPHSVLAVARRLRLRPTEVVRLRRRAMRKLRRDALGDNEPSA